ncbi:hypothetical protein TNCV_2892611 [Trichonephila clavipes]|nr:hypothetical protein TNCV_2892611 [Trichonephila clavipes]
MPILLEYSERLIPTSYHKNVRGLVMIDLGPLNHSQMTKVTPAMAPSSSNFHNTPLGGDMSLDIFNEHRPSLHGESSAVLDSNS